MITPKLLRPTRGISRGVIEVTPFAVCYGTLSGPAKRARTHSYWVCRELSHRTQGPRSRIAAREAWG